MVLVLGHRNPFIPIRALVFGSVLFVVLLADWRRKHAGGAEANATCVRAPVAKKERHPQKKTFSLPTFYAPRFLVTTIPFIRAPPKEKIWCSRVF